VYNNYYIKGWWRSLDQQVIFALAMLFGFSIILVTTSSPAVANRIGLDENYFSSRHIIYLILAGMVIAFFSALNHKILKRIGILGFLATVILLILVKFLGQEVKGSQRWISILGVSIQPSEFAKPFFAIVTGWILSLKSECDFPSFSVSSILYAIVGLLLIIQPDFGMLLTITAVFGIQLFVAGMPIFWIIVAVISVAFGTASAYLFLPHVTNRINSFFDPEGNENYQVSKSILAFEHGGFYGKGPGEGAIKQVLPDSHTDFIFAVAGEEFGAIVCLIVIFTFAFIVIRTLLRLITIEDKFAQFAATGIVSQFAIQSLINIGVTLNLLPTKGMTLPFISYGGSSTIAISIGIGTLLGLTRHRASLTRYRVV
jgi:cell division protein FtsW